MAELLQLPAVLDIHIVKDDDLSFLMDFDIDLTGYTFKALIEYSDQEVSFTIAETDLAAGQVTLSLTEMETVDLPDSSDWFFQWTKDDYTRTILSGKVYAR